MESVELLNFILGRFNSKSRDKLYQILKEKIDSNKKIVFIVPEQNSFYTELKLLDFLGDKKFNKINVLSFSRLYDFISRKLNIPPISEFSEIKQIVAINSAIEEVRPHLKIYKNIILNEDTVNVVLSTFKEMSLNKIDNKVLENIKRLSDKDMLTQKISEIQMIIERYEKIIETKFSNSFSSLDLVEEAINSNKIFDGYEIFIDGFNNFTKQQFSILKHMLDQSQNMYMSFICDNSNIKDIGTFSEVYKTISNVKKLALDLNIEIAPHDFIFEKNYLPNDLNYLEENIFSAFKKKFSSESENIVIYNALDQNEECAFIAGTIKKMVFEEKYKYSDFTVLTRDMAEYSGIIKNVFKNYDIPYFIDSSESIFYKSVTNTIFSAFDAVKFGYDTSGIFNFLKSGLIDISTEEICTIENYVLLWNINGKAWESEFKFNPKGIVESFSEKDILELENINKIKEKFFTPLKNFKNRISNATGKQISKAVYDLLCDIDASLNLKKICTSFFESEDKIAMEKEAKTWDIVIDILSEIAEVVGNKKISIESYINIFSGSCNFASIDLVPQTVDSVFVGEVGKSGISNKKVVFIIGAVNGKFPKCPEISGLFTDKDIDYITSLGIEFIDNAEAYLIREKFLCYCAVCSATERLFVSWPASNFQDVNLPSEVVTEIIGIFPSVTTLNRYNFTEEETIWSEKNALEIYAKNPRTDLSIAIEKYFSKTEEGINKCNSIKRINEFVDINFKDSKNAKKLFGNDITISASQIEKYYKCRFGYFCEYVLKAKSNKPIKFDGIQYGNITHFFFENLFKKYPLDKNTHISDEILKKEIEEILNLYISKKMSFIEENAPDFIYLINRLKKSLLYLSKRFLDEFKQSEFKIADLELIISKEGDIPPLKYKFIDGTNVNIEGKIDRVDTMNAEQGEKYIRIIDYKTGDNQKFNLSDILYGLNTQMLIYLMAIKNNGQKRYGKIIPAGILYFRAIKPFADSRQEVRNKLCMSGLVLNNEQVILGMDSSGEKLYIPVEFKNGKIEDSKNLVNLEEFGVISKYIEFLVKEMITSMKFGKISSNPKRDSSKKTPCDYCEYFPICRYEKNEFYEIKNLNKKEDIFKKMKEMEGECFE